MERQCLTKKNISDEDEWFRLKFDFRWKWKANHSSVSSPQTGLYSSQVCFLVPLSFVSIFSDGMGERRGPGGQGCCDISGALLPS